MFRRGAHITCHRDIHLEERIFREGGWGDHKRKAEESGVNVKDLTIQEPLGLKGAL